MLSMVTLWYFCIFKFGILVKCVTDSNVRHFVITLNAVESPSVIKHFKITDSNLFRTATIIETEKTLSRQRVRVYTCTCIITVYMYLKVLVEILGKSEFVGTAIRLSRKVLTLWLVLYPGRYPIYKRYIIHALIKQVENYRGSSVLVWQTSQKRCLNLCVRKRSMSTVKTMRTVTVTDPLVGYMDIIVMGFILLTWGQIRGCWKIKS